MSNLVAMSPFQAAAVLVTLAAALSWFNARILKLPSSVGLALMGALASICVILLDRVLPDSRLAETLNRFLGRLDFHHTLMDGMLSFLLFAGALHVDLGHLRRGALPVALFATLGVLASTAMVGAGMALLTHLAGLTVPLAWCLLFGALISPTDPVAVLAVMKHARTPPVLQATVSGESLFNDGVGVVVFGIILDMVVSGHAPTAIRAVELFAVEAFGGVALGLLVGWVGYRAMRSIDDYPVELLITLAMVMGGYTLAQLIHVSGPVAMAVSGLLTGNQGVARAMSETTRDHIIKFWSMIDEVLNAVLFLLIGLLAVVAGGEVWALVVGLAAVPLVFLARAASVGGPLLALGGSLPFRASFPVLVWGGLRGGISIALALSLPAGPARATLLTATYVVVLFSVLVQGLTINGLLTWLAARKARPPPPPPSDKPTAQRAGGPGSAGDGAA